MSLRITHHLSVAMEVDSQFKALRSSRCLFAGLVTPHGP